MNQQNPQNPPQPNWGQQPQQPQWGGPQQPGWGAPPPPPRKSNTGRNIGIGCAGAVGLLVIVGIFGAALGGDSDDNTSKDTTAVATKDSGAGDEKSEAPKKKEEAAPESPIKVTAKETAFKGSILAQDGNYTSVSVTITNNSDDTIDVNPLYFAITDSKGTKHASELAADENQIDTVELAPGENVTGAVTGKGKFTPKTVTYTDGLIGESIRADVS
ncbi:hypothetical protein C6Y14_00865 [Streptomyces dioscori]|uniref:DUF4352 domain-containing protein n=1 Tax=Streptomyces dioscori TaxID=2109333 RepID=A0A2P8QGI0_9ACTN|nr:DUF4352 domain-containing protein [Streptomyces dioscori]PSM45354.1 hypothetical protein C6Y14_00865 [Streptomyces dioscori]